MNTPIIGSLLDLDLYKLTMLQFIHRHYGGVPVVFSFLNRTKDIDLTRYISESDLQEELAAVRALSFTDEEIAHLAESAFLPEGFFTPEFLRFLRGLRLPDLHTVWRIGGCVIDAVGHCATLTRAGCRRAARLSSSARLPLS